MGMGENTTDATISVPLGTNYTPSQGEDIFTTMDSNPEGKTKQPNATEFAKMSTTSNGVDLLDDLEKGVTDDAGKAEIDELD